MQIQMICGNPSPGGRTSLLGNAVAAKIASLLGAELADPVELALYGAVIFDSEAPATLELIERTMAADVLVIASPTYKATYTGLLKCFLDLFGAGSLHGRIAIPVMTGGSSAHSLAPDFTLRPVLAEIGASLPCSSLYAVTSSFDRLDEIVHGCVDLNRLALLGAAHGIGLAARAVGTEPA